MASGKPWYQSKTVWFNVVFLLLAIISTVANFFGYADFTPNSDWAQIVVLAVTVINLILRYVTTKPINPIMR